MWSSRLDFFKFNLFSLKRLQVQDGNKQIEVNLCRDLLCKMLAGKLVTEVRKKIAMFSEMNLNILRFIR